MLLRRIEIKNYRKFIDPVVIENIGDGITVIAGDNEEGKSTVLQALRTVLFDRYNLTGDAAEAMQPFGYKVRPEIALEFEIGGQKYHLTKGYCQRPSAELRTPTGTLPALEAEEKLQELLRFRPPGRGQGRPDEHHGVFGMFWIEQGRAFAPLQISQDNRGALMGALETEVGQVLGGSRGRALKEAISAQYRVHFTETGRVRGAYADSISGLTALEGELQSVTAQLSKYDGQVDELSRTRERLTAYEQEGRLSRAQHDLERATAKREQIHSLKIKVRDAENAKRLGEAGVQGPTASLRHREDAIARERKAIESLEITEEAARRTSGVLDDCSERLADAADTLRKAEARLEASTAILESIERYAERQRLVADKDRISGAFDAARKAEEAARQFRALAAAIKIDVAGLRRLRSMEQKCTEADAALAGSSTLIKFELGKPGLVRLNDGPAPQTGDVSITEPIKLEIASAGSITVVPGGEELSVKRAAAETTRIQLNEALKKIGATSVTNAESLVDQRQQHIRDAEAQEGVLSIHAPEGTEKLAETLFNTIAVLGSLPETTAPAQTLERAPAQSEQKEADRSVKAARTQDAAYREQFAKAQQEHAGAKATAEAAGKTVSEVAQYLQHARETKSDADLRQELARAVDEVTQATVVLEQANAELAKADPEASELAFEAARDGVQALQRDIDSLKKSEDRLSLELKIVGQQGLGETVQDLEGRVELARVMQGKLARDAAALKLLYETLGRLEQRAREAFLAPVQKRVQPYLRFLLPNTELVLSDDDLGVTHLRRNGQDEPFESLSVGAREQVAVLTRLAFADLLRERGVVAPVVLDDALVNTDPRRFERMLMALRRAAKNMQIIVLTCDEADWVQAGAPLIRLADCRTVLPA